MPTSINAGLSAEEKERRAVKALQNKIDSGTKVHEAWEKEFECDLLEGYYSGTGHWPEKGDDQYTINLCHSSVEQRKPSMLFNRPKFTVRPRQGRADDAMTAIEDRVKLREDTLNTFLDDEEVGFMEETKLALHEAHFRFGMIEVGYDAESIDNPNKGQTLKDDKGQDMIGSNGQAVMQSDVAIASEALWVKRIRAACVRFPINSHNMLHRNEWVAYYEWQYIDDLQKMKAYSNTDKLKPQGRINKSYRADEADTGDPDEQDEASKHQGMVKVWKMWNLKERKKYVWPDNKKFFLLEGEPFKTFPLAMLKFYPILDSSYPVPVMYNWISPQNELNETRTGQKIHRKRFHRRYLVIEGKLKDIEMEKLKTGGDGTIINVPHLDVIRPLEDAQLDRAILANVPQTREDFFYVSETTGEQVGVAESDTATQAQIIDVNTRIRQTQAREFVAKWLAQICYIMLQLIEEKMTLPFWIMKNVDPLAPMAMAEAARIQANWMQIKQVSQLGKLNYDVVVDMESLSPVTEDTRRAQHEKALTMLANPAIALLLSSSDALLKRTLSYMGIRGDKEVMEIKMALMLVNLAMATGPDAGGGKGGPKDKKGGDGGTGKPDEAAEPAGPSSMATAAAGGATVQP